MKGPRSVVVLFPFTLKKAIISRMLDGESEQSGSPGRIFPNTRVIGATVAQKIAPMFACYGKTHALLNDYIR